MHASRFVVTSDHMSSAGLATSTHGLIACPMALWPCPSGATVWAQEVYRRAYEQALAAVTPTWYERVAVPSVN
jgi:hypothetical protein